MRRAFQASDLRAYGHEDFPLAAFVVARIVHPFEDLVAEGAGRKTRRQEEEPPRTPVHQILSPHARDAFGIFLVVVALVAVLGLWFDAGGPGR